jgi:hypothetical protein
MKVKELIEQLQRFDKDTEVLIIDTDSNPLDSNEGWECSNTFMITNGSTNKSFVCIIPAM